MPYRLLAALLAACLVPLLAATPVAGKSLFEIFADAADGTEIAVGGSSLPDLVENLIDSSGDFAALDGQDFTASLTYAGVADALNFELTETANDVTVRITSELTGLDRTFTGSTRGDVEDDIEDWLLSDGTSEYAKFQQAMQRHSPVAVLDGNPASTTALLGRQSYRRWAMPRTGPDWLGRGLIEADNDPGRGWFFSVSAFGDFTDASGFDVVAGGFAMDSGRWFTEHVGFALSSLIVYVEVEDAAIIHGGTELAIPIRIFDRRAFGEGPFDVTWQITPFGNLGGAGSIDMAAGGLIWGVGAANRITLGFDRFDVTFASQLSHYEGLKLSVSDYSFKPELSQQLLVNGVLVTMPVGTRFYLDGGVSYSRYLDDAAIQDWVSPTAGAGVRLGTRSSLGVAYTASFGDNNYDNHHISLSLNVGF